MPLFWCEPEYLIAMLATAGILFALLRILLRRRQSLRRKTPSGSVFKTSVGFKIGMASWLMVACLFLLEFTFGAFVEFTDAFSATNVSDRWFDRYIEPYRNDLGFRDLRQFPKGKQHGFTDVFYFGDSFTIGQGIENIQDLFVNQSESLLNAKLSENEKPVRTFNAAEFGWEVSYIQGILAGLILKEELRPDVVVYIYMLNDIEGYDPRTEESIRDIQKHEAKSWLWTRTYFFNWLYFRWQQSRAQRTVDYFPHLADSYREKPWQGVQFKLAEMKANCDEIGAEFRMVFFPFLHNLGPDYEFKHAHQQLTEFCLQNNIRYLDLEPILTERFGEGLMVNRFDNHPNELCHQIVAEAIVDQLLDDLSPPE